MKARFSILTLAIVLFLSEQTKACDICGCGAGSYYIGILPEFNSQIMGLRYRSSALTTHLGSSGKPTYLTTDEYYHTIELWGGWTIKERFRIMGYLPFSYNTKQNSINGFDSKTGISDASLIGFYRILRSKNTIAFKNETSLLLVQDLWIGGGLKLPTGKYQPNDKNIINRSTNLFQLGTGSTDFVLMGMYDIRLQDAGLNITASYKINTTNRYDYYYGNRFSASSQFYYKFRFNNRWMIAPNFGFHYEHSMKDLDAGYSIRATGGEATYATLGAELNFEKISIGANVQPVLRQNLGHGMAKSAHRTMLHFSFLF